MNDKKAKKLSFILYEESQRPKYIEIKKKLIQIIFVGLPLIATFSIITLILFAVYFKNIKQSLIQKEAAVISKLQKVNSELLIENTTLTDDKKTLSSKLATTDNSPLANLQFFKTTPGQMDQTSTKLLSISDLKISINENSTEIKFKIENNSPNDNKIAGYAFIVMNYLSTLIIYPTNAVDSKSANINYTSGEYFSTQRFRRTKASFPIIPNLSAISFKIIIFSRLGDLIGYKHIKHSISKEVI